MSADRPVSAPDTVTDDMVGAWTLAAASEAQLLPGLLARIVPTEAIRAGLEAVVPLIRERVAAERRCTLCSPGSPEEIRQCEEASAELDRLIEDDEDLPPGVYRESDGGLVMEPYGPPRDLADFGTPVLVAPPPGERDVIDMGFLSLPAEIQAEAERAAFDAADKGVTKRPEEPDRG